MRRLEILRLEELLTNRPTLEESIHYVYNWYKDRESDYGDTYKDEKLIKECGEFKFQQWLEATDDNVLYLRMIDAEMYQKGKDPNYDVFGNIKMIYSMAKMAYLMEQDKPKKKRSKRRTA